MSKTRVKPRGQPYGLAHPARNQGGVVQAHQSPKFGRDKSPLIGGACNRFTKGVFETPCFSARAQCKPKFSARQWLAPGERLSRGISAGIQSGRRRGAGPCGKAQATPAASATPARPTSKGHRHARQASSTGPGPAGARPTPAGQPLPPVRPQRHSGHPCPFPGAFLSQFTEGKRGGEKEKKQYIYFILRKFFHMSPLCPRNVPTLSPKLSIANNH